jgi:Ino eighty subunit 2
METINKLLKKQAPKINKKAAAAAAAAELEDEEAGPNPAFVRWVNSKSGSVIGVPKDMAEGPAGRMFANGTKLGSGKMVEEVA